MRKKNIYSLFGLVCAIGLTFVQSVSAQPARQRQRTEVMHMTLPEQQKAQEAFAKKYPLIANRMELHKGMQAGMQSVKPVADVIRNHRRPSIMKDAATNTTFLGSASYIYILTTVMPTTVSAHSIRTRLLSTSLYRMTRS